MKRHMDLFRVTVLFTICLLLLSCSFFSNDVDEYSADSRVANNTITESNRKNTTESDNTSDSTMEQLTTSEQRSTSELGSTSELDATSELSSTLEQHATSEWQPVLVGQNQYVQFMTELNPSIAELDELFYHEMDVDGDGNMEIIAAFGASRGDPLIETCFVLREQNGVIKLVKQNFFKESGYAYHGIQLVRFTDSDLYYIVVGITNTVNMNGLSIYKVIENDVLYVDGAQSAVGVCDVYLSDKKDDGSYGGFTAEFFSYDVLYYPTVVTYYFQNGVFNQQSAGVTVGEYPDTPTDVVIQYLSLYCLHQQYFSNDIIERCEEIFAEWLDFSNFFEHDWYDALFNYRFGFDSEFPFITADEAINGQNAKVTIYLNENTEQTTVYEFDMVTNNGKWQIVSKRERD